MICTKCEIDLPDSEFYKNSRKFKNPSKNKKGLCTVCKVCTNARIKEYRINNKEKVRKFSSQWRKNNPEKSLAIRRRWEKSALGVYATLKKRGARLKVSKKEFVYWYNSQKKICVYCGISEELAKKMGSSSMYRRLNIDRKDNEGKYSKDNIVLACATCNRVKADILSYKEMLEIGKKYIAPRWRNFIY